jgi:hypothetical protein
MSSGLTVTNRYDQFLRRTNLSLLSPSSVLLSSTAYVYDDSYDFLGYPPSFSVLCRAASGTDSTTRLTEMPIMQRKSTGRNGGSRGGLVRPTEQPVAGVAEQAGAGQLRGAAEGTTTGVPSAAATCMGPVSLLSRAAEFQAAIARGVVWPAKLNAESKCSAE